jgi:hypothetical protein
MGSRVRDPEKKRSVMAPLNDLIAQFAARRGLPPPTPDPATGGFAFALDGRYAVHLREIGGAVVAWAWLADLPTEEGARGQTMRRLLRAELARFGEDDVVLSLDETAGEIQLHHRVARDQLDVERLSTLLQSLVDGIERRRALLTERRSAPPMAPMIIRP